MTDISKHSLEDLLALHKQVAGEIDSRRSAEKAKAQKEIMDLASRYGLAVQFGGAGGGTRASRGAGAAPGAEGGKGKGKGSVAIKYRHPDDENLTWTGRGRSPAWVADWKAKHGGSLDKLAVQ